MLYNQHNLDVAKIASTSDIKPEFASVYFTPTKTVATDSSRLLEVSTPDNVDPADFPTVGDAGALMAFPTGTDSFMVNARKLATIKLPKNKSLPVLNNVAIRAVSKSAVEFITNDLESADTKSIQQTHGTFPNYEQVFPTGKPLAEVTLNAELLAGLLENMGKLNKLHQVTIKVYEQNRPLVLEVSNDNQRARGLIMPMKS